MKSCDRASRGWATDKPREDNVKTQYWLIAAVWYYSVVNYLDRVALSFAAPSIMKSLAIDPAMFGSILASFAVGYAVSQLPGGLLADRWNAKTTVVVAPLVWAFFTGATAFVTSPAGFMAIRIGLGLSEGIALGAIFKIQFDNFTSEQRPLVAAIGLTPIAVAPAIAGPIVGLLVSSFSWHMAFLVLVVPSVLVSVVNWALIPSKGQVVPRNPGEARTVHGGATGSLKGILRLPSFWSVAAAWFCFNFAYWGYNGWMPSYLALERHLDIKSAGALGGLPYLFGFFGLILTGWLGTGLFYRHRPQLLSATFVGGAIALYAAYTSDTLQASLAGLSFSAFFLFGGISIIYAVAADLSPESSRGTYWGAVSTVGQIAGAIAPWLIGNLVTTTGTFAAGFLVMVAMLALAAVLILFVVPQLSRTGASAPKSVSAD